MKVEKNKEDWINEVMNSMDGSKRAVPNPALYHKILDKIDGDEAKIITMPHWSKIAAVAVLLIIGNVFAVQQISQNSYADIGEVNEEYSYTSDIFSDYKIYE